MRERLILEGTKVVTRVIAEIQAMHRDVFIREISSPYGYANPVALPVETGIQQVIAIQFAIVIIAVVAVTPTLDLDVPTPLVIEGNSRAHVVLVFGS